MDGKVARRYSKITAPEHHLHSMISFFHFDPQIINQKSLFGHGLHLSPSWNVKTIIAQFSDKIFKLLKKDVKWNHSINIRIAKFFFLHTIRKVKFLSKNSILTKPQHFHEFFTQKNRQFSRDIKVEFLDKKWRFRTVWMVKIIENSCCHLNPK